MNDDELRRRFHELKRSDASRAPPFERLVAKRPRARIPLFVAVAPIVAAAAVFVVWCGSAAERSATPMSAVRAAPHVRVEAVASLPLDFLLDDATTAGAVHLDADPLRGLNP